MSRLASTPPERPRRRADAERSVAAILDAAVELLATRPDASMGDIAAAAGVSRQTVYAHFRVREALLTAVAERALGEAVAAIDASRPEEGHPAEALDRLIAAWWGTVGRHARVLHALAPAFHDAGHVQDFHRPILERVEGLVRRGQRAGDFDRELGAGWLAGAFLAVLHEAADQVAAGELGEADAGRALARSLPRLFRVS